MTESVANDDVRQFGTDRDPGLPYIVLSCSVSLDGYISSATGDRLLLSNDTDFDRVDAVRAGCDAILVGAQTIRADNPRLLIRDPTRRAARQQRGLPASPVKVTVTRRARLDRTAAFFHAGADRLVYCASDALGAADSAVGDVATVIDGGVALTMRAISADLFGRGVRRLMVEGGTTVHTQFLTEGIADELHLVVAPVFVGDDRARRFVEEGSFPWHPGRRGHLQRVEQIGDVALLTYALSARFFDHASSRGAHDMATCR